MTGEVTDREALIFSYVVGVASIAWLALTVNLLSAALSLGAILFYVVVYTLWLKRRTPRTSSGAGSPGACRCSSAGPP
nr:hypothetical protein GCM10025699_53510 [Microbacterium flavescens]